MRKIISAVIILCLAFGCKKEKINTETTFSYVKSVTDSIVYTSYTDYISNYYFYNNGWIAKDSFFQRISGASSAQTFLKSSNKLEHFSRIGLVKTYFFNSNEILTQLDRAGYSNSQYTYDDLNRLLYVNTIYPSLSLHSQDTLIWSNKDLVSKKSKETSLNSTSELETTYQYDLTKINNLRNQYLGYPFKGFDDYANSEHICTSYTTTIKHQNLSVPSPPSISIFVYTFSYTFDSKNRISTITINRNGLFDKMKRYTYYD